jgi:hypothetical protein
MDQSAPETPIVPADTTMYLSVPEMRIHNVPVVECANEASLTGGVGHLLGSGCPWVEVSNTYIAGHRLRYAGTPSEHVFYDLPNLVAGDEILLTESNGTTYTTRSARSCRAPRPTCRLRRPWGGMLSPCKRASRTTATTGPWAPTGWPATSSAPLGSSSLPCSSGERPA